MDIKGVICHFLPPPNGKWKIANIYEFLEVWGVVTYEIGVAHRGKDNESNLKVEAWPVFEP